MERKFLVEEIERMNAASTSAAKAYLAERVEGAPRSVIRKKWQEVIGIIPEQKNRILDLKYVIQEATKVRKLAPSLAETVSHLFDANRDENTRNLLTDIALIRIDTNAEVEDNADEIIGVAIDIVDTLIEREGSFNIGSIKFSRINLESAMKSLLEGAIYIPQQEQI